MTAQLKVLKLGRTTYMAGQKAQNYISSQLKTSSSQENAGILIFSEFSPVYTIGIRTKDYTIKDEEKLKSLGAEFYKTNRGGLITFHGPGQMVCYPVINLKYFRPSVQWYVCHLEKTVISMLSGLGVVGETSPHTGVWVKDRKICAIGIHGSRYVTTHGIALNCSTDLKWFDHIVPCGIEGKGVTSLSSELGRNVEIEEAMPRFLQSFSQVFNCHVDQSCSEKLLHEALNC